MNPRTQINSVYLAYGGAAGVLGLPAGRKRTRPGARSPRSALATTPARCHSIRAHGTSGLADPTRMVSCNRPASARRKLSSPRFPGARGRVRTSCTGQIREPWLQMGAESGELGCPICREERAHTRWTRPTKPLRIRRDHVASGKRTDRHRARASRPRANPTWQSLDGGATIALSGPAPDIASCRKIQAS